MVHLFEYIINMINPRLSPDSYNISRAIPEPIPTEYDLRFLCSLIHPNYDGDRHLLHEFLSNCRNSNILATPAQRPALLAFMLSKLRGSAIKRKKGKLN